MSSAYEKTRQSLAASPAVWLVTGVAGFIGSNLLETLLKLDQNVIGLDNFETGHRHNLEDVRKCVTSEQWRRFHFIEGNICDLDTCRDAMRHPAQGDVDYVLHQAALGSVPRSIENPVGTNAANVDGFLNLLVAARDAKVKRFVYAASSSTYGDHPDLPKVEGKIGRPLSPYAVTKLVNELYADVFGRTYGFSSIGLRYFNVFGRRQDPQGAYAAVIPKWIAAMMSGETVWINGDGETSRDFCYIDNAIQANVLAAMTDNPEATNQVYNIAVGESTTLNELYELLRASLAKEGFELSCLKPSYRDFRPGDVRHSLADISKATSLLGYAPYQKTGEGIRKSIRWYMAP